MESSNKFTLYIILQGYQWSKKYGGRRNWRLWLENRTTSFMRYYQPHQALLDLTNSHLIHVVSSMLVINLSNILGLGALRMMKLFLRPFQHINSRIEAHFSFHFIIKFNTYTFRQQLHNNRKCHLSCENRA